MLYDGAGNLIRKKDSNNISIQNQYDYLYRLAGVIFPDSTQNITYI
jgi:YD repeat-containing protein